MASCRSCGASIEWATAEKSGKPHPVDAAPDPRGKFVVVGGVFRGATADDDRLHRERRTSHFATCADAQDWRSR